MIQEYSRLTVADNSGAKEIMCFRVLGRHRRRYARIGDIIVASVKDAIPEAAEKGGVATPVIVRTPVPDPASRRHLHRSENAAVIITEQKEPRGTRIFGRWRASCGAEVHEVVSLAGSALEKDEIRRGYWVVLSGNDGARPGECWRWTPLAAPRGWSEGS